MTKRTFPTVAAALALRQQEQKIQVYNLIANMLPASVSTEQATRATLQRIDDAFDAGAAAVNKDIRTFAKDPEEAKRLIREVRKLYPRRRHAQTSAPTQ